MAEVNPAGWLQNAGATHTAAQLRTYVGSTLTGAFASGAISRTRGGVHPSLGTAMQVTANGTPNMTVNVAAGVAFIPGTENTSQGVYSVYNDASVNLSITTAPGAGLNRIDLIVAKVQDTFYSGAINAWSLAVVTGTAASSPSPPTPPNNSISLAQVFVGANVTSIVSGNITDVRPFAAALGGVINSLSIAPPTLGQLTQGQPIYYTDKESFRYYNGSIVNSMPGDVLGGTIISQNHVDNFTTTEVVISNFTTPSIVIPANRLIEFRVRCGFFSTVSADITVIRVRETNLVGTEIGEFTAHAPNAGFGNIATFSIFFPSGAGTTKVYVLTGQRVGGAGTCQISTGSNAIGSLIAIDRGPISRVSVVT